MARRQNRKEENQWPEWTRQTELEREKVKEAIPWHQEKKEVPWYQQVEAPRYDQNEGISDRTLNNFMASLLRSTQIASVSEQDIQAWFNTQPDAWRYFSYVNTDVASWVSSARELGCTDREALALGKALQNSLPAHR